MTLDAIYLNDAGAITGMYPPLGSWIGIEMDGILTVAAMAEFAKTGKGLITHACVNTACFSISPLWADYDNQRYRSGHQVAP